MFVRTSLPVGKAIRSLPILRSLGTSLTRLDTRNTSFGSPKPQTHLAPYTLLKTSQYRGPAFHSSAMAAEVETEMQTHEVQKEEEKAHVHDAQTKHRKDYTQPPYWIDNVHLNFILNEDVSHVHSSLSLVPNSDVSSGKPLVLNGHKDMKLLSIKVNGQPHPEVSYTVSEKELVVRDLPSGNVSLEIVTETKPQENSALEGLYKSGGNFSTQCEAEGFRRITYFYDRPDVMSKYTTRIEANKASYPVLLSNGNLQESGDLPDGRHFTVWVDPFPKPCYLFALVAGTLSMKEREYVTSSGKKVALRIFVAEKDLPKVDHALDSLIKSMKWDEETFGLEYDLDLFNIVAVDDFNMGAMENKSLNIFNSRLVLASPETATDLDYARIEGVVGHEYFHNWTGNRVTCRDWFQLTLKEGLTVYRDQEFSADMNSRPLQRINDVMTLRTSQFTEDAGPMAHPIRPESYIKMDNFYTVTVYEKGAEVVRLYRTMLGKQGFRKGMDLYFQRHDGHAVTCDDFLAAMADANGVDLSALGRWYEQAGTPKVHVSGEYNASAQTYTLTARQSTPPSPGQEVKQPVLIPLAVGLLGPDGKDMPLHLRAAPAPAVSGDANGNGVQHTVVLRLEQAEQQFVFEHVDAEPVPSVLRNFSAPVRLEVEGQTDERLLFLFANDSDPFNRWESGQRLSRKLLLSLYAAASSASVDPCNKEALHSALSAAGGVPDKMVAAFKAILTDDSVDGAYKAVAVSLPSSSELYDTLPGADPTLMHQVRMYVVKQLAACLRPELQALLTANDSPPGEAYAFNATASARRAIKAKALGMLSSLEDPEITAMTLRRYREATNMTDQIAALGALVEVGGPERETALSEFFTQWESEPLVILKWLGLQAMSNVPGNVELVKKLVNHKSFNINNPNNCYSLFLAFSRSPVNFHASDNSGYEFMADSVLTVDKLNPQVASRMVSAFTTYKQFDASRQAAMRKQLERIVATNGLSENVLEIATKSLA